MLNHTVDIVNLSLDRIHVFFLLSPATKTLCMFDISLLSLSDKGMQCSPSFEAPYRDLILADTQCFLGECCIVECALIRKDIKPSSTLLVIQVNINYPIYWTI